MFGKFSITIQKRLIHQVPRLKTFNHISKNGIEGLFSPAGIKTGWIDYQKFLVTKLSLLTVGTDFENKSCYQILKDTAANNQTAPLFHYASQSHNNHLFYEQLTDKSENKTKISNELMTRIKESFVNLENFQSQILSEADLLAGQGWVFLVEKPDKSLAVISSLNEGTPYFYGRNQTMDLNGPIHINELVKLNELKEKVDARESDYTLPLLLINCWEYAYLEDYGVNGRSDYLENLWDCINWDVVNDRLFSWNKLNDYL